MFWCVTKCEVPSKTLPSGDKIQNLSWQLAPVRESFVTIPNRPTVGRSHSERKVLRPEAFNRTNARWRERHQAPLWSICSPSWQSSTTGGGLHFISRWMTMRTTTTATTTTTSMRLTGRLGCSAQAAQDWRSGRWSPRTSWASTACTLTLRGRVDFFLFLLRWS